MQDFYIPDDEVIKRNYFSETGAVYKINGDV